jgi:hypothetical protein
LQVLHQRDLEDKTIVKLTDDDGNGLQPGALGSEEAAFSGDQLVAITAGPDQQRLEDSLRSDRDLQLME